jgi:hypothetical protein
MGEPPPGGVVVVPPPHEWRLERPTVSSYWPAKGKAGSRVVIHGENFAPDMQVMYGPELVRAAKVDPDRIMFEVPRNGSSATIVLKRGGRDLIVGNFEVTDFDADAEAKRDEAQREAAARQAWAAERFHAEHDAKAREAAFERQWQEMDTTREQRRAQRLQEIRAKWQAAFLSDPDTQSELTLHARRVAELGRLRDIAGETGNEKLGVRVSIALARENDRHDRRMAALKSSFDTHGGER